MYRKRKKRCVSFFFAWKKNTLRSSHRSEPSFSSPTSILIVNKSIQFSHRKCKQCDILRIFQWKRKTKFRMNRFHPRSMVSTNIIYIYLFLYQDIHEVCQNSKNSRLCGVVIFWRNHCPARIRSNREKKIFVFKTPLNSQFDNKLQTLVEYFCIPVHLDNRLIGIDRHFQPLSTNVLVLSMILARDWLTLLSPSIDRIRTSFKKKTMRTTRHWNKRSIVETFCYLEMPLRRVFFLPADVVERFNKNKRTLIISKRFFT